jgi:hypothetical protein
MKKLLYILLFVPVALFGQIPPQVGDIGYGGIVFHVDEYVHVASLEKSYYPLQLAEQNQYYGYPLSQYDGAQDPEFGVNSTSAVIDATISNVYTYGLTYPTASLYALTYNMDGFDDWFIPNNFEFNLIKEIVISSPSSFSDITGYSYWSINRGFGSWQGMWNYSCNNCFTLTQTLDAGSNNAFTKYVLPVRAFPIVYGCTDEIALNFDTLATVNDNTCEYQYEIEIQNLEDSIGDLISSVNSANDSLTSQINSSTIAISSLQLALDTWNTTLDLSAGWNMFGYVCPNPINITEGLSNHTESIAIVKDNNGNVYMPEFAFNGIGDLTPGFGYQIKLTEAIEGFSLCDWYVNDIPEDNIVSLQDSIINMHNANCIQDGYCSFDNYHQICITPEHGFDCNGDTLPYIGMQAFGGIVFYIDSTGKHGLVSSMVDATDNMIIPDGWPYEGYRWGNSQYLSTNQSGYTNTINYLSFGYQYDDSYISAFHAATGFSYDNYNDWYLPSIDELVEMYDKIGLGSEIGNVGLFNNNWYWSSSDYNESSINSAKSYGFYEGVHNVGSKNNLYSVRPIRSF